MTTEDGYHGWGEGTSPPTVAPVAATIRSLEPLLKGESAWNIEKLWRRMYITEENTLGGTLYAAISAIDIALWDIAGKKLNAPVYKLLGGKIHDRIRIYTSYRWGNIPRTRDAYFRRTKELIAQGASAGKYDPFGAYPGPERQLSSQVLAEVREMLSGIRDAGPTFDICVEAHGKFNIATAGRIVKMLEPLDPFFLEEPVPPENMEALAALQSSTNIPIATGEGIQGHFHFAPLLEKRAARILQPDVSRTGGITAMKKIAAMADAHYVTVRSPQSQRACVYGCKSPRRGLFSQFPHHGRREYTGRGVQRDFHRRLEAYACGMACARSSWSWDRLQPRFPEGTHHSRFVSFAITAASRSYGMRSDNLTSGRPDEARYIAFMCCSDAQPEPDCARAKRWKSGSLPMNRHLQSPALRPRKRSWKR